MNFGILSLVYLHFGVDTLFHFLLILTKSFFFSFLFSDRIALSTLHALPYLILK